MAFDASVDAMNERNDLLAKLCAAKSVAIRRYAAYRDSPHVLRAEIQLTTGVTLVGVGRTEMEAVAAAFA